MAGDIVGNATTNINFEYNPKTYSTAECEVTVRTSEFDSKPITVRVVGSAQPNLLKPKNTQDNYYEEEQQEDYRQYAPQTKTLL
jgi:hypothetical protein|tara:strand:+ start:553 stop:804 length:252 start_codon:yes stop_codon:yes gene_type:complete